MSDETHVAIAEAIILHVVEELNKKDIRCYDSAIVNELRITPDSVLEAIVSPKDPNIDEKINDIQQRLKDDFEPGEDEETHFCLVDGFEKELIDVSHIQRLKRDKTPPTLRK